MFDIGWGEFVVIGVVALIVIGPKELPGVLRTVGQAVGKIRRLAGEFQGQFQEAMREAELHEARKTVEGLGGEVQSSLNAGFNPIQTIRDEFKPTTPPAGEPVVPLPSPPPEPDLTADQIQASFAPQTPAAAEPAGAVDALPAPTSSPEAAVPKAVDGPEKGRV
ncbi:MAG: Sec-independent protein translocase protein TatB [Alsobacter sp.]